MADINSNKNAIIIQPITLQIRAPFQFLTNQRAIKHTHYSESRNGLNGRYIFSAVCQGCVCGKRVRSWTVSSACKVEQISPLFHLYLYLFFKFRRAPFCSMLSTVQMVSIYTEYGSRLMAKEEKSTFQISLLLLSSFISNIYTPEKSYYWQNQPNGPKVKGI